MCIHAQWNCIHFQRMHIDCQMMCSDFQWQADSVNLHFQKGVWILPYVVNFQNTVGLCVALQEKLDSKCM